MKRIVTSLMEITGRSEDDCKKINEILNHHVIIGRKEKEKIVGDFCRILNIDDSEANKLYNQCMEVIVKGIFKK